MVLSVPWLVSFSVFVEVLGHSNSHRKWHRSCCVFQWCRRVSQYWHCMSTTTMLLRLSLAALREIGSSHVEEYPNPQTQHALALHRSRAPQHRCQQAMPKCSTRDCAHYGYRVRRDAPRSCSQATSVKSLRFGVSARPSGSVDPSRDKRQRARYPEGQNIQC